jgi:hypothetical protein
MPVYLNLDPLTDYPIIQKALSERSSATFDFVEDYLHFAPIGHQKIADDEYSFIKYFGSLDQ